MFEGQRTTYKNCFSPSTVWVLRLSCPDYTYSGPKFEFHHPIRLHGKFLFLLSHLASPLLFSEIASLAEPGGHWLVCILAGRPVLTPAVPCSHGAKGLNHPNDDLLLSHLFVFLFLGYLLYVHKCSTSVYVCTPPWWLLNPLKLVL